MCILGTLQVSEWGPKLDSLSLVALLFVGIILILHFISHAVRRTEFAEMPT